MNAAARRKRKARSTSRVRPLALGYIRVSTAEQVDNGASMAAQQTALQARADHEGWDIEWHRDPGVSGTVPGAERPGMGPALAKLAAGDADILLATALDRVGRNLTDVAGLMNTSVEQGWSLVSIRDKIDTSSAMGRAMVHMALVFSELERGLISERVVAGMAQKRLDGQHVGRHSTLSRPTVDRIHELRDAEGLSWPKIAAQLQAEGIPTATGGDVWRWESVRAAHRLTRVGDELPPKHGEHA